MIRFQQYDCVIYFVSPPQQIGGNILSELPEHISVYIIEKFKNSNESEFVIFML